MNDDEYQKLQDDRKRDNFIVGEDEYNYRDQGGEIWEHDSDDDGHQKKGKKKNKPDPHSMAITSFMKPQSLNAQKEIALMKKQKEQKTVISEAASKDILENLANQIDEMDAEDLEDVNAQNYSKAVNEEVNKPVAFSKDEQTRKKFDVCIPQITNNKKRNLEEFEADVKKNQQMKKEANNSNNSVYFDAQSKLDNSNAVNESELYKSAVDDESLLNSLENQEEEKMQIDTSTTQQQRQSVQPRVAQNLASGADDWNKIKQEQQNTEDYKKIN